MIVQVYYNLHKQCWSIRSKRTQRVIKHTDSLIMTHVKLVARPGGRERVRKTGRKNVHAFVEGEIIDPLDPKCLDNFEMLRLTYDPYRHESFVLKGKQDQGVDKAMLAHLDDKRGLNVWLPEWRGEEV